MGCAETGGSKRKQKLQTSTAVSAVTLELDLKLQ
jgi:hypothetical protein